MPGDLAEAGPTNLRTEKAWQKERVGSFGENFWLKFESKSKI